MNERDIFLAALEIDSPNRRTTFLDDACGEDVALRERLDALIRVQLEENTFLEHPFVARDEVCTTWEGPGTQIGRYKLLEEIGVGGFGVVYMAEQLEPVARRVALKVIKLGMDTKQVIGRFEAERQALAMMDHPNIAKVFDGGATAAGRPYFVMELVNGIPINEYCDASRLTTRERLRLFVQVCNAVQHAHQKGIIHRDLKPSNILVTMHDSQPVPKVIDFGVAKATQQRLTEKTVFTRFQHLIGTPLYMSPEQATFSDLDVDTRSDIYSLGVLLYELLTGTTPLDAARVESTAYDELCRIIREDPTPLPSSRLSRLEDKRLLSVARDRGTEPDILRRTIRGDLDWIVMKALDKDRKCRYETANLLATDVNHYLNHEPIVARPPNPLYRLKKLWQRNRVALAAGTIVAVSLLIATGVSVWQAVRATHARDAALESEHNTRLAQYVTDMNLANQAIESSDFRLAREKLERHRPKIDSDGSRLAYETIEDLRGWEWWYLWDQLQFGDYEVFARLPKSVEGLELSPDGHYLAAASDSGIMKVWDVDAGNELRQFDFGPNHWPNPRFFSGSSRLLYNAAHPTSQANSSSSYHEIWDPGSRKVTPLQFNLGLYYRAIHPDEQRILFYDETATGEPSALKLYDLGSKRVVAWEKTPARQIALPLHQHFAKGLLFSAPEAREWILGDGDGNITVFSAETGERIGGWSAHRDPISALAVSPDGDLLASAAGYNDRTIKLWQYPTGKLHANLPGHQGWVRDLEFTTDGKRLVSASADQTVRIWNLDTFEATEFRGHEREVAEVEVTPDDRTIFSGCQDGSIYQWDISAQTRERTPVIAANIRQFAVSRSANRIAAVSLDGAAKIGSIGETVDLKAAEFAGTDNTCLDLSTDGSLLITGKANGEIAVWEIATERLLHSMHHHDMAVSDVGMLKSNDRILSRDQANNVILHEMTHGNWAVVWEKVIVDMGEGVTFPVIDPDEQVFATGSFQGVVTFWDLSTGEEREETLKNSSLDVVDVVIRELAFSPEGDVLAMGERHGAVRLWDMATRRELDGPAGHRNAVGKFAFSPDGRRLVSTGGEVHVIVWDLATRQEVLRLAPGKWVDQIAFSADGNWLFGRAQLSAEFFAWHAPR